jgi:hypothetical protein
MDKVVKTIKNFTGESDDDDDDQTMKTVNTMTGEHGQMLTAAVVDVAKWVEENVKATVT